MSTQPTQKSRRSRHSPTTPESPEARTARALREKRTLLYFVALMLVFGIVCWFGYPHANALTKQWLGRRLLPELHQHLKAQNWQRASEVLRDARRWAPNDPEVLHASLEFNSRIGGDPRGTISLVRQLQEAGAATPEDLILMGKMHARLGEISKAREIYDRMPAETRQQQHGLELHAYLLKADGLDQEAAATRRTALESTPEDPESLRQLAVMDLSSNDPSRRRAMSDRLWQIARSDSPAPLSLTAIELLASIRELSVPQVDELFQLIEAVSAVESRHEAVRFVVLSARLRLNPHLRTDLIDEEIMHWKNRPHAQTAQLLAWLGSEREYARILRMVPAQTAGRYTDLLPSYVDALRGEGRWQELNMLLTSGDIDTAYPAQRIRLWQVEAQFHLNPDPAQARQTLMRIYEEAGRGDDPRTTLAAGNLAEKLNQWDLAEKFYEAVAAKHSSARQQMLTKIYQMAGYQSDGPGMLHACTRLLVLQPERTTLLAQKLYLQLLLGIDLELAQMQLPGAVKADDTNADQLHLLQALAAYRAGEMPGVQALLSQVAKPEDFAPGERSVYAALLKLTGGDAGRVFRLVERISPALLLPEEKAFLQRALAL